jgi:outer membrane protein assembly factor BamB
MRTLLVTLAVGLLPAVVRADDWPQWLGPQRDGVWREKGLLDKFPKGGPRVCWRTEIGPGFSGPAVADGKVYLTDRKGEQPPRGVESAGKEGKKGVERVLCLNEADGKLVWKHEYDRLYIRVNYPSGPRCTPVVHQGKVYSYGTMGDLVCLDAATGKSVWSKNLPEAYGTRPPVWGYSTHPLVAGDKVFVLVGGKDSAVVALNKDTGAEVWKALTVQEVGYAPPILIEAGGAKQLIAWHSEAVNALDPETGKLLWSVKLPAEGEPMRPAITSSTPVHVGGRLFVSCPHHGSLMLKLAADKPAAEVVWRSDEGASLGKPDKLHSLMSSVHVYGGYVYGVCALGELRCLKADTGEQVWETFAATTATPKKTPFCSAFFVRQGERYFLFNEHGELIIARLTPKGYEEIDRAKVIGPTLLSRGRDVVWSHPAFANRKMYVRNDKELICIDLAGS